MRQAGFKPAVSGPAGAFSRMPVKKVSASHPSEYRMADFARFAIAAECAPGWPKGSFHRAYGGNAQDANQLALDNRPKSAGGPERTASHSSLAQGNARLQRQLWRSPGAALTGVKAGSPRRTMDGATKPTSPKRQRGLSPAVAGTSGW